MHPTKQEIVGALRRMSEDLPDTAAEIARSVQGLLLAIEHHVEAADSDTSAWAIAVAGLDNPIDAWETAQSVADDPLPYTKGGAAARRALGATSGILTETVNSIRAGY